MADYNSQVLSLLGKSATPEATINRTNTFEQLYTVSGRTILCPADVKDIGVSSDTCSETLRFRIPRYFDGVDLAQHTGKILFINAATESGVYQIMNAEVSESCINFEWCLNGEVTKAAGTVNFAIRFETINAETDEIEYRWTTTPCTLTVLAGIAWSDENIAATYPTVLEQWLQEMTDLKAEINDMALNVGGQITGATEATEKANTAAQEATEATGQANTATTNANDAADAANAAATAANEAATNANKIAENANASIVATKDAAIENINTAKDATIAATQEAAAATTQANTATENANDAADAANAAAENLEQIKADALAATIKANNAGEYPLAYGAEIAGLQIGDSFKKNQIWRVKETYANNLGIRAGLYICRFNYVHTDATKTFVDLLGDYTFVFMLDEGKGEKGEKGDTPVLGVDYYTEAEKTALAEEIAALVLTDVDSQLDTLNGEVV